MSLALCHIRSSLAARRLSLKRRVTPRHVAPNVAARVSRTHHLLVRARKKGLKAAVLQRARAFVRARARASDN